jgi:hypothetical protein
MSRESESGLERVPQATLDWLLEADNPAVAVLTRRTLLGLADDKATHGLWARRNEYPAVSAIIGAMRDDGSWDVPSRDYQKYRGSLWQIHLLGELWADGEDVRLAPAFEYAFSRQRPDGSWSASNMREAGSIPCLTANVGRALARLGFSRDERVIAALEHVVRLREELGMISCRQLWGYTLNGYCHMLTPKLLLFLAEIPRELWPTGAEALRDECISKLRDKSVYRCLPTEARQFFDLVWTASPAERDGLRERFLAEHPELHYGEKPGWKRFGYPLSYNSDALEALLALTLHGESPRPEYDDAIALVRSAGGEQHRWALRTTLNGKMYADVEKKGAPSKWLTLRALSVLKGFDAL